MTYAALIAILGALAFILPLLAGFAARAGVPQSLALATAFAAAVLVLAGAFIRQRVARRTAVETRIVTIQDQRAAAPDDPAAFYYYDDHLGDLLLTLGREREALRAFEAYQRVAERAGLDAERIKGAVIKLRRLRAQEEEHEGL